MVRRANTAKEVLVATKWIIQNIGWCKGNFSKMENGKPVAFCIQGALNVIEMSQYHLYYEAAQLIKNVLVDSGRHNTGFIAGYNDAHSTTKKDVIKVLNEAIKKAK